MNQMNMNMNMAGFNANNAALGNMPMANAMPNGAVRMPEEQQTEETNYEGRLNSLIYEYFCNKGQYDSARALKNSNMPFDPPLEGEVNGMDDGMHTDSKNGIDKNRPDDLPTAKSILDDGQGGSFLLGWFALFWDIYFAQRKSNRASNNAVQYVQQTQQQARLRQEHQQRILQGLPMGVNSMDNMQQMMRYNQSENLRQRALANNRPNGMGAPTPQQIQAMRMAQMGQQGMRRGDLSEMDMNGQRPRTPSTGDHAPSPSKRQRMDGAPFNPQQMMPNGRGPPPGIPPNMMGGDAAVMNANHLLMNNGINPGNLSDSQFASFQQQNPTVQQKSIQVYAQNLANNQRQQSMSNAGGMSDQGSPFMDSGMGDLAPDFYGGNNPAAMQMRGAPPNVPNGAAGGNHALQDYQMQLMLLEQQNKKRLLMARQEQDTIGGRPDGQPGMPGPGGYGPPGMSPGSRGGPSPGPSDTKRGTPKMNQVGLPPGGGSPMPDNSMRSSPAAMNFNGMNPDMYAQMNGNGMRPPPSSNPGFPGQFPPQQMEAMARANGGRGGMPNGWQQGPQPQAPVMGQPPAQQPAPMGTPQTRNNEMPPPQGVPGPTPNGRPASPAAAPPTPQTGSKPNPKTKKETKDRKRPTKKNSTAGVVATPASEAESANPPTPTPATPSTPQHPSSFGGPKSEGQPPTNMMPGITNGGVEQNSAPQPDPLHFPEDLTEYPPILSNPADYNNGDLLDNFDFEQFLQTTNDGEFGFDPAAFGDTEGIEAGMTGT